jgi:hypothetical protein
MWIEFGSDLKDDVNWIMAGDYDPIGSLYN